MREFAHLSVPALAVLEEHTCGRLSVTPGTESCLPSERCRRTATVGSPSGLGDTTKGHSLDVLSLLTLVKAGLLRERHLVDRESVHTGSTRVEDGSLLRGDCRVRRSPVGLRRSVQSDRCRTSRGACCRRDGYTSVHLVHLSLLSGRHRRSESRALRIERNKRCWWGHSVIHGHTRESAGDKLGRLVSR